MLDVDKIYGNSSSYLDNYWKNNLYIDQSYCKINIEDNKQKINKIIENEHRINLEKRNYNNSQYSSNRLNNKFGDNNHRIQYIDIGMCNKQDTYKYRKFQKYSEPKIKRENNNLSHNCRINEYNQRERKILLDAFSKPKLLNN